ncbi:PAS domain-containing sensor histidine kinase [Hymenobacter sp. UYP22]|uniref:sensor histidine kinase n=1 Tax=Hymenobacter sp. UYP22 TaxID=3156348 RepID=UPI0033917E95
MVSPPYPTLLADLLYTHAQEFVGLYDLTLDWFTQVNAAGWQLLGYPSEQALLTDAARQLSPAAGPWPTLCEQARRQGRCAAEIEVRRYNAGPLWLQAELAYCQLADRPFLLVRLLEQSRLQQAERELAHSVRRFEAVFASATIGIIVCDREGTIVSANQFAQQLFGYAPGTLPGQRIEVLVPTTVNHRHEHLRASFNAHPQVRSMGHNRDLLARRQDGSVFPVEVSLSYFHLDEALYVVSYILDITFKKEAEQELIAQRQRVERLNAELEQKVADRTHALLSTLEQLEQRSQELTQALRAEQELGELKSRFVSMASHEFRTPLTAVLTSTALIEKYPGADQQDKRLKHLQRIRASVNHLNDILEEFLSVGRIEEGRIEARPVALDLPALVRETVADVQGLRKAGQAIVLDLTCPAPVHLDPSLLRKILVNLLSNALKYSGENSEVAVQAQCRPGQVIIRVRDQGVGISPEDQQHLFERFFRARSVTNIPGTGLGLYIIARYLELMGGTIALQSQPGVGTTVTVTIPTLLPDENHSAD